MLHTLSASLLLLYLVSFTHAFRLNVGQTRAPNTALDMRAEDGRILIIQNKGENSHAEFFKSSMTLYSCVVCRGRPW